MAKQAGAITITGTLGNITFYKRKGKSLARAKTSLDKERVKTDLAFANSMKEADKLGKASPIASLVYHKLPTEMHKHGVFGKITGRVKLLMHEGKTELEIHEILAPKNIIYKNRKLSFK
jgi:hypothetical protein